MSEPEPDSSRLMASSSDESKSNALVFEIGVCQQVFSNDLLLKEIIENLQMFDLQNCRLVNKKYWEPFTTRTIQMKNWKERRFINFSTPEEIQKYCDVYGSTSTGEETSRVPSVLFSCFRVSYPDYFRYSRSRPSAESNYLALEKLIQTFPHKIKSLDLELDLLQLTPEVLKPVLAGQWSSLAELRLVYKKPSYSFTPVTHAPEDDICSNYSLPNLKYLCLCDNRDFIEFPSGQDASNQLGILDLICSKIPPGNQIKICLLPWGSTVVGTITVLTKYQLINSLKVYKLNLIRSGDFQILGHSGVQLEFLLLYVTQKFPVIATGIREFLQSQSNCLKMLEWPGEEFEFPPIMKNLSKLKLDSTTYFRNDADNVPAQHTPILYGQRFPKLEFLELSSLSYFDQPLPDFHSKFLAPQFPCNHLQILRLTNSRINAETINLISEIFPRIRILDVGKYDNHEEFDPDEKQDFYSSLWSGNFASTLEEFSISLDLDWSNSHQGMGRKRDWINYELDSLFSGLNRGQIALINISPDLLSENSFEIEIQSPCILNFTNLKKLEIFANNKIKLRGPQRGFTDFSAFTLFGQLKKLEYLHIGARVRQFSEAAVEFLRTRSKITNRQNEVAMKTNDLDPTSTERIEKAFNTNWNLTNMDQKLHSFNLFNP